MSTLLKLVVVVPTSAGDINHVINKLEQNRVTSTGITLTTGEGFQVDVLLEDVREVQVLR